MGFPEPEAKYLERESRWEEEAEEEVVERRRMEMRAIWRKVGRHVCFGFLDEQ